jgi:hypothetical protein
MKEFNKTKRESFQNTDVGKLQLLLTQLVNQQMIRVYTHLNPLPLKNLNYLANAVSVQQEKLTVRKCSIRPTQNFWQQS